MIIGRPVVGLQTRVGVGVDLPDTPPLPRMISRREFLAKAAAVAVYGPERFSALQRTDPYALILGMAQDSGMPQVGCYVEGCERARARERPRYAASMSLVYPDQDRYYLAGSTSVRSFQASGTGSTTSSRPARSSSRTVPSTRIPSDGSSTDRPRRSCICRISTRGSAGSSTLKTWSRVWTWHCSTLRSIRATRCPGATSKTSRTRWFHTRWIDYKVGSMPAIESCSRTSTTPTLRSSKTAGRRRRYYGAASRSLRRGRESRFRPSEVVPGRFFPSLTRKSSVLLPKLSSHQEGRAGYSRPIESEEGVMRGLLVAVGSLIVLAGCQAPSGRPDYWAVFDGSGGRWIDLSYAFSEETILLADRRRVPAG